MKAITKFMKMYFKLPDKARSELMMRCIIPPYNITIPYSLNVMMVEVLGNTKMGKEMLKLLGYEDD